VKTRGEIRCMKAIQHQSISVICILCLVIYKICACIAIHLNYYGLLLFLSVFYYIHVDVYYVICICVCFDSETIHYSTRKQNTNISSLM